jgi:predicted ArsR family transcriptional regulator
MQIERPTRLRLLDVLKQAGPRPVRELRVSLGVSSMAVRQHLTGLERDGLVQRSSARRPLGRPESLYALTPAAETHFPKRFDALARELLEGAQDALGPAGFEKLLAARLERQVETYSRRVQGRDVETRLQELAAIQDENGFMTSCDPAQREIVQHNCAICSVAERFPEMCRVELQLFERLLGAKVERVEHRLEGGVACRFHVILPTVPKASAKVVGNGGRPLLPRSGRKARARRTARRR